MNSEPLSADEQVVILERARNGMRDLESAYYKQADSWHNRGAKAEAQRCYYMAEAVKCSAVILRTVEAEFLKAKNATY